jgi:hypothetical protein
MEVVIPIVSAILAGLIFTAIYTFIAVAVLGLTEEQMLKLSTITVFPDTVYNNQLIFLCNLNSNEQCSESLMKNEKLT